MHLVQLIASPFVGGPERQVLGLAAALAPDIRTTFLSFAERGLAQPFLAEARQRGFTALELRHNWPRFWSAAREIAALLHAAHADILLCNGYKPDIIGGLAARWAGIPALAIAHGWTGATWKVRLNEALDRRVLRRFPRTVCVSAAQARRAQAAGIPADQLCVIHNAVAPEAFAPAPPAYGSELRALLPESVRRIVVAAGRLSAEKGFDVLVDAAALARQHDPHLGFVVFGHGPEQAVLQERIAAHGLTSHFVLAGFRADAARFLGYADLVAIPSYTEGLPVVLLEAFAAGTPVVATAVGGIPEVVEDGRSGYLTPPGNPAGLSERIVHLANADTRRAMGQRGRDRVQREFSTAVQAAAFRQLLTELLRERVPVQQQPAWTTVGASSCPPSKCASGSWSPA